MKVAILEPNRDLPLIDLLGGYAGPFSGEIPVIDFESQKRSDYLLAPHDWWDIRFDFEYVRYLIAASKNKTLLLFNRNDFPGEINSANVIYIQNSIEVGGAKKNRVIVPYNVNGPEQIILRKYGTTPIISFMGYLPKLTLGRFFRSVVPTLHPIKKNSAIVRSIGLERIKVSFKNAQLTPNSSYGGARSQIAGDLFEHRARFLSSINSSDLIFCPRGDANASQRFFETLAMGRIPLVPDTDIQLPKNVSWKDIVSIKLSPTLKNLKHSVTKHWESLNDEEYKKAQESNFKLYNHKLQYRVFLETMFKCDLKTFELEYIY